MLRQFVAKRSVCREQKPGVGQIVEMRRVQPRTFPQARAQLVAIVEPAVERDDITVIVERKSVTPGVEKAMADQHMLVMIAGHAIAAAVRHRIESAFQHCDTDCSISFCRDDSADAAHAYPIFIKG
jgi:hypothetical protein